VRSFEPPLNSQPVEPFMAYCICHQPNCRFNADANTGRAFGI
jgi:hypothetical protein